MKESKHHGRRIFIFEQYGVFKYRIGDKDIKSTAPDKAFSTEEEAATFAKLEVDAIVVWSDLLSERAEKAAREHEKELSARMWL
jgi:hypothetical protein